jgi:serine phosphatase RsbU (regulator of sigma subunit)
VEASPGSASPGIDWLQNRLQYLQTLSAALADARTEQQAIDATLNRGLAVFEADQAVVATLREAGDFRIRAVSGYGASVEAEWATFPNSDEYPLSEAVRHQQPVVVQGAAELARRYPKLAETARSATLICLPMGEFAGVALGYDRERLLNEAELEFMTAVARQCGEAIRRAQLDAERRRRGQGVALLAEAGAVFAGSLDYERTLADVASLAVPRLADCCIVDVLESAGVHQIATVHVEPQRVDRIADIERRYPADPAESNSAVGAVLRSGEATLVPEVTEEFLSRVTRDDDHREAIHGLGMRSLIIAPLIARGRTLGAITLIQDVSGRRYDEQDLATARNLADRAALAIDNARLYQAQIDIAKALQQGLLPGALPVVEGVEVATRYVAAGEGIEVGGDFYDLWLLDDRSFGVAIGDVSGKGPAAAAMTSLARHTVRVASIHERTPSRVLRVLNEEIRGLGASELFCTAAYAHASRAGDGGLDICIALGGHAPGLVRRRDGTVEEAGVAGTLMGVREQVTLTDHLVHVAPGEALVLYTDGVTEHRIGRRMFGEQGLVDVLRGADAAANAEQLASAIERAVSQFSSRPPRDDIAVVVIRVAN